MNPRSERNVVSFKLSYSSPYGRQVHTHPLRVKFVDKGEESKTLEQHPDVSVAHLMKLASDIDEQVSAYILDRDYISAVSILL
jgi:hypothetical protein